MAAADIKVQDHFDPDDPEKRGAKPVSGEAEGDFTELDDELMAIAKAARTSSNVSETSTRHNRWQRSLRSYRNQHALDSKYDSKAYWARSKLHVPKTRTAVRNNMTATAQAMFGTSDAIKVSAENDGDDLQRARGETLDYLLKYRLDRSNPRAGIPFFLVAMGARQDAEITGLCCSKQFWEYEERPVSNTSDQEPGLDDEEAGPDVLTMDGEELEQPEKGLVLRDRPYSELIPLENVIIDSSADWLDPAQSASFLILDYPLNIDDAKAMMKPGRQRKGGGQWHEIPQIITRSTGVGTIDFNKEGVRRAREGGVDRLSSAAQVTGHDRDIIWVQENFIRHEGEDYHFWSYGSNFLTDPRPVEESYPAMKGYRPIVIGYGAIETHNIFPMSPVESWRPLQMELNDIRNLRLDANKQNIAPIAKVRAGRNVDLKALRNRGPDATILMQDVDDVKFEHPGGASRGSYEESMIISTEFDELAGVFSGSSVQNNRKLNETVGGMRLLVSSADAQTEFDLRVFIETWAEPALRQIMMLIQYYETDEKVLALAGKKSGVWKKYGYDPLLDDLSDAEVTTRVSVGIGSSDPNQRMGKLASAIEMSAKVLSHPEAEQKVTPKFDQILQEIFSIAGYRDAARFFEFEEEAPGEPEQPDPAMMQFAEEMKLEREKLEASQREVETKAEADIQGEQIRAKTDIQEQRMEDESALKIARLKGLSESLNKMMDRKTAAKAQRGGKGGN